MRRRRFLDEDGVEISAGSIVAFSYGIPPVAVVAPVVVRKGKLIALTTGHNPPECEVGKMLGLLNGTASVYVVQPAYHVRAWRLWKDQRS